MFIDLEDEKERPVYIRTFKANGGGVEFESEDSQVVSVRREDLPTLVELLKIAMKELKS